LHQVALGPAKSHRVAPVRAGSASGHSRSRRVYT